MVLRVQLLLQLVNRLRKDQKHQKILSQHEKTFKPKAYSTAADVARMSIYAMRRNAFSFIVRQPERQIGVAGATAKRSYTSAILTS